MDKKQVENNVKKVPDENMPVMMIINELSRMFHNRMRSEGEKIGMQEGFRHILINLALEDDLTQLDLVQRSHLKAPTISVALRNMEQAGLVIRHTDDVDQRQTRVRLTPSGREMDRLLRQKIKKTEDIFISGLSESDCKLLKQLLLRMRNNIISFDK